MGRLVALFAILLLEEVEAVTVTVEGEQFLIDGKPTYFDVPNVNPKALGMLLNSRMVQAFFDDENPETRHLWRYPDGGEFDPERNTDEFVAALPLYKAHGVIAFTINLQCGGPRAGQFTGNQPWHVSGFSPDGSLKPAWLNRLKRILDAAQRQRMVVILGLFYFGQDQRLRDEDAVKRAVVNAVDWLMKQGYRHVHLVWDSKGSGKCASMALRNAAPGAKVHLGEIQAVELTEAGVHDAKAVRPMPGEAERSLASAAGDGSRA